MNTAVYFQYLMRLAGGLGIGLLLYGLSRKGAFLEAVARETEGLNTLILLLGSIYSVMLAFVIFVIWGQFADVENYTMKECGALKDLARFSHFVNPDSGRAIRRALVEYGRLVADSEWAALGQRQQDPQTERAFDGLMNAVIRTEPGGTQEAQVQERLIDILRKAGEYRDERVAKSLTRIPPTLIRLVMTIAAALLLLVFVYPFHNPGAGAVCFALVAVALFLAHIVLRDTDNPFDGVCSVSPEEFRQLGG